MKKTILLLTLCLMCIYTHAQKIDRSLLSGRWELYSVDIQGLYVCRDSIAEIFLPALRVMMGTGDSTKRLTPDDSTMLIESFKAKFTDIFKSYITFDEKGNEKLMFLFPDDDGELDADREKYKRAGTYEWSGDDRISQKLGGSHTDILIIASISATRLTINPIRKGNTTNEFMTFTRAK
jgi:hypothetical protein